MSTTRSSTRRSSADWIPAIRTGRPIPIAWIQSALDPLVEERVVDISVESVGFRSAFVGAVLAQVPGAIAGHGAVRLPAGVT